MKERKQVEENNFVVIPCILCYLIKKMQTDKLIFRRWENDGKTKTDPKQKE